MAGGACQQGVSGGSGGRAGEYKVGMKVTACTNVVPQAPAVLLGNPSSTDTSPGAER